MSIFPVRTAPKELEWNDLTVILAIGRSGSLSGAARLLGQNHSTVFRKINTIEQKTGVRFFERLPQGYKLTDAGATTLQYAERIEAEVHALGREILGQDLRLQGKLRLTAPEGFATILGPKLLYRFCREHPDVSIEMEGGSSEVNLSRREADIAIRATASPPDTSLGRKVCDFRFALYTSQKYIDSAPQAPLAEHRWCLIKGVTEWLVPLIWKKRELAEQQTVYSSSLAMSVLSATAAGIGLTLMPCYLADPYKGLLRASDPIEALSIELWILTHPDLRHTARVKAAMGFFHQSLTKEKDLFEGNRVRAEISNKFVP